MTWFGWLTKGHYEVTVLDKLTFVGEVFTLVMLYLAGAYVHYRIKKWKKKK